MVPKMIDLATGVYIFIKLVSVNKKKLFVVKDCLLFNKNDETLNIFKRTVCFGKTFIFCFLKDQFINYESRNCLEYFIDFLIVRVDGNENTGSD